MASKTVPLRGSGLPLETLQIRVVEGPDRGLTHVAQSEVLSIGTAPGNDVVLTDDTVSKHHVQLTRRADRVLVEDCGSTNGTMAGGVKIERGTIPPGSEIAVGRSKLVVEGNAEMVSVELYDSDQLGEFRGRSADARRLMATMSRVAPTNVSILVIGETGTGKEVVARSIHATSDRADRPFETVDCGAMMPTLVASELFGHEKGAFTGADKRYSGAFERADGGTVFLDEIGELPANLQPALLGVLERQSFRRLGSEQSIRVNVRVIGATNRDLRAEVNAGNFREDLYYRIAHMVLRIPPLRDRTDDIPVLVEHMLRRAGFDGPVEEVISPATMSLMQRHRWPGNVRELRNFVETTLAIGMEPELWAPERAEEPSGGIRIPDGLSYDEAVEFLQRRLIDRAMNEAGGVIGRAAEILEMERSRLSKLRRRLGQRRDDV